MHLDCTFKKALKKLRNALDNVPSTDNDLEPLDPKERGQFYDLLMKVDKIFKNHGIPYWATCGTLLGAVRHEGMVPWDDDIDIAIFENDVASLLRLNGDLARYGLAITFHPKYEFYKIFPIDGELIYKEDGETYPWRYPFVDIFPQAESEGVYTYVTEIWRDFYRHKDHFTLQDLQLPLPQVTFGPMKIPVPHAPVAYLERMYGKEWDKVAYVTYDHRREQFLPKIKVDLTKCVSPPYKLPK